MDNKIHFGNCFLKSRRRIRFHPSSSRGSLKVTHLGPVKPLNVSDVKAAIDEGNVVLKDGYINGYELKPWKES